MRERLPWPRFVPTLVSRPNESVAYLTGGYELKLKATAASRALHAPAQKSVARYDINADHWWEVPTERQWREVMGFDWRDARQVAAVSAAAFTRAMREDLPAHRYGQVWEVPNRKLDFTTRYITEDDYVKGGDGLSPDSERCRHGRNHRGCLPGFGVQRNGRGARIAAPLDRQEGNFGGYGVRGMALGELREGVELGELHRRDEPTRSIYAPVWHPPLDFDGAVGLGLAAADGYVAPRMQPARAAERRTEKDVRQEKFDEAVRIARVRNLMHYTDSLDGELLLDMLPPEAQKIEHFHPNVKSDGSPKDPRKPYGSWSVP